MNFIWSLFIPQSFPLFASSYYRRHLLKRQTVQTVQKLGERRQWFPLNRPCMQKLIKDNGWQESLMIISTGWKTEGVLLNLNKAVPVNDCTSRVFVGWFDRPSCWVLGHSMNSHCSAVWSVDCEHHGRRSINSVQHWLSEKVTPKKFSHGDLAPDGDIRRLNWRGDPLSSSRSVPIMLDTNVLPNSTSPSFRSSC